MLLNTVTDYPFCESQNARLVKKLCHQFYYWNMVLGWISNYLFLINRNSQSASLSKLHYAKSCLCGHGSHVGKWARDLEEGDTFYSNNSLNEMNTAWQKQNISTYTKWTNSWISWRTAASGDIPTHPFQLLVITTNIDDSTSPFLSWDSFWSS